MWAFLCMEHVRAVYHHVRRTQGLEGTRCARGEVQLLGGNRFLGRSRSAPDLFVFPHSDMRISLILCNSYSLT